MTSSMASALFLCCVCAFSLVGPISSLPLSPMCPHQSTHFLSNLQSKSPLSPQFPLQVNGEFLDRNVKSNWGKAYISILFYKSSCLFSYNTYATFSALSSMFPQIEHLAVEQSAAMPSTFSRYGIHSLPTIIVVNKSSVRTVTRFQGAKDFQSLIKIYKRTTGLEPVHHIAMEQPISLHGSKKFVMQSWIGSSPDEILSREPYLVLALLFLCLRALVFVLPKVTSHIIAFWRSHRPSLKLELFGETSHLVGRILHIANVKRIWTKLKLYKTRTFQRGATSSRVWASSLASVSLRKTSSSR